MDCNITDLKKNDFEGSVALSNSNTPRVLTKERIQVFVDFYTAGALARDLGVNILLALVNYPIDHEASSSKTTPIFFKFDNRKTSTLGNKANVFLWASEHSLSN